MSIPRETLDEDENYAEVELKNKRKGSSAKAQSTNGNGYTKDARGKFAKGNKGGPGNPHAGDVGRNRKRWMELATSDKIENVFNACYKAACGGDVTAIKYFCDRSMGKVPDIQFTKEWTSPEDPSESDLAMGF